MKYDYIQRFKPNPEPAWLKTLRITAGMVLVSALMWIIIICAFVYA